MEYAYEVAGKIILAEHTFVEQLSVAGASLAQDNTVSSAKRGVARILLFETAASRSCICNYLYAHDRKYVNSHDVTGIIYIKIL